MHARLLTAIGSILTLSVQGVLAANLPQATFTVDVEEPVATPTSAEDEYAARGFTVVQASFSGPWGINGETLTLNGTIEEVVAQVEAINPDFDWDAGVQVNRGSGFQDRVVARKDCSVPNGRASRTPILDGVRYLYTKPKDQARLQVRTCSRVSCSYNAAIYLCWDPVPGAPDIYTQPWSYVADYAEGISMDWCPVEYRKNKGYWVGGKTWDPVGLGVDVRLDRC